MKTPSFLNLWSENIRKQLCENNSFNIIMGFRKQYSGCNNTCDIFFALGCPPCYSEIQRLVNRLRINIRKLVKITNNFNSSSSGQLVVDADFERRLKELTEAVNELLNKAESSNSTDKSLQEQLSILDGRVNKINEALLDVSDNTSLTEEVIASAVENISEAEAAINRSRTLLDEAERLFLNKGARALNEAIQAANSSSEQAIRMAEILNEVMPYFIGFGSVLKFVAELVTSPRHNTYLCRVMSSLMVESVSLEHEKAN